MSRTAKSVIFYSVIGISAGIGIMFLVVDDQTLRGLFQQIVGQSSDNPQEGSSFAFAIRENYRSRLAVGEEGEFKGVARGGKEPYKFEWKFSDGQTLIGQNVTRSFQYPGRYTIEVTVTDADGKQVKNTNLFFDVLQELPKVNGTLKATLIQ